MISISFLFTLQLKLNNRNMDIDNLMSSSYFDSFEFLILF
jgi:hypothetical protein